MLKNRKKNTKCRRNHIKKVHVKSIRQRRRYKKVHGGNDNYNEKLKKVVQQIFENINIDNDDRYELIHIDNAFAEFASDATTGGGAITYTTQQSDIYKKLKSIEFDQNTDVDYSDKTNMVIIGGGPVGLYMSILLKLFFEDSLEVVVLESRHNEQSKRILERCQVLVLRNLFEFHRNKIGVHEKMNLIFKNQTHYNLLNFLIDESLKGKHPALQELQKNQWYKDIFAQNNEYHFIPINLLEYTLANFAQTLGVNILHTEKVTPDNLKNFINENTQVIFDATGGRFQTLRKHEQLYNEEYVSYCGFNIIDAETPESKNENNIIFLNNDIIIKSPYGDAYYTQTTNISEKFIELQRSNEDKFPIIIDLDETNASKSQPFKPYQSHLIPETAVTEFDKRLIIPIGNSYMQTNFQRGYGIYYGFLISALIAFNCWNLTQNDNNNNK